MITSDLARDIALAFCDEPVQDVLAVRGGGNNRLFKIHCSTRSFALKWYPPQVEDPRDRLGAEFRALHFLHENGPSPTPRAFHYDPETNVGVYEWIEGAPPGQPGPDDIDSAVSFAASLYALSKKEDAQNISPASEACFSAAILVEQIERRAVRLEALASEHPSLKSFLSQLFRPRFSQAIDNATEGYEKNGLEFNAEIPEARRTLSPSDFGFHNAIRREDKSLVFLDFEYFGWDDPVKLVSDFLLHPGMNLTADLRQRFCVGAGAIFSSEPNFTLRFQLLFPLFALRWSMILLNEFLPERLERRKIAGHIQDTLSFQEAQLQKAEIFVNSVPDVTHHFPFEIKPSTTE